MKESPSIAGRTLVFLSAALLAILAPASALAQSSGDAGAPTPAALPVTELAIPAAGDVEGPAPTEAHRASEPLATQSAPTAAPGGKESDLYRLNAGDVIEIKSSEDASLNEQVRIGPDGMISYALVGYVRAAGNTLPQMDDVLTGELRKVIRDPKITIFVREYASQIVYVGGEVEQPKEVRIAGSLNPISAIFAAGGFTDGANRNRVTLIRRGSDGQAERRTLDLEKETDSQMELAGFDVLVVPPTFIAQADQYVDQYVNRIVPNAVNIGFSYIIGNTALR